MLDGARISRTIWNISSLNRRAVFIFNDPQKDLLRLNLSTRFFLLTLTPLSLGRAFGRLTLL
jgi:hypothetical protein